MVECLGLYLWIGFPHLTAASHDIPSAYADMQRFLKTEASVKPRDMHESGTK